MNHLERIVASTRQEVEQRKRLAPPAPVDDLPPRRAFADALRRPGLSLIAEYKRRSPSAGAIRDGLTVEQAVTAYQRGGAAALSVLTEARNFDGSLEDLRAAHGASTLPILRKDFIVDSFQVTESAVSGADAILLIVAALSTEELRALHDQATELGLAALVEVHDAQEMEAAAEINARLIGINNRDLTTLEVDPARTFELGPSAPLGATLVAESGFSRRQQLDELAGAGIDAVLIGEALMRSADVEAACRTLTAPTMLT